jgi:hypothetical protein
MIKKPKCLYCKTQLKEYNDYEINEHNLICIKCDKHFIEINNKLEEI